MIILYAVERRIALRSGFGRQQEWSSQEGPHEQATVGRSVRKDGEAAADKMGADLKVLRNRQASKHRTGSRSGKERPSGSQRTARAQPGSRLKVFGPEAANRGRVLRQEEQPATGTRKPELVSQDLDEGVRKSPDGRNTGGIQVSAQWGLAAMPAPISHVGGLLLTRRRLSLASGKMRSAAVTPASYGR